MRKIFDAIKSVFAVIGFACVSILAYILTRGKSAVDNAGGAKRIREHIDTAGRDHREAVDNIGKAEVDNRDATDLGKSALRDNRTALEIIQSIRDRAEKKDG